MPVLKGAVTFARYKVVRTKDEPKDLKRSLSEALRRSAFEELDPGGDEDRASGWVELEDQDAVDLAPSRFIFGDYLMVSWRVDTLRVPTARVKAELDRWARVHEAERGEHIGRVQAKCSTAFHTKRGE